MAAAAPVTTTLATGLDVPFGVAVDAAGDVWVADAGSNRVVEIAPDGTMTTIGGRPVFSHPEGVAVDASGDLFVADAGGSDVLEVRPHGSTDIGDGAVTIIESGYQTFGVAVDPGGAHVSLADGRHLERRGARSGLDHALDVHGRPGRPPPPST